MEKIQITTPGIKKALKRYEIPQAIAEYIWNGFDAKADCVEIIYKANAIGGIDEIKISDNGSGILHGRLRDKFTPFFESEKELDPNARRTTSAIHGKNGVGRLTFFTFANSAEWQTVYNGDGGRFSYKINVSTDGLNTYSAAEPSKTNKPTGTVVTFSGIHTLVEATLTGEISEFLMREFGWFLELNSKKSYKIKINGKQFNYSRIIGDREDFRISLNSSRFDLRYVQWNQNLNREYSRYYFIDSSNNERFKETTTLNYKGDQFYHSIYIQSDFFDQFDTTDFESGNEYQPALIGHVKNEKEFKELIEQVDKYLRDKRKPFLKNYTDKLIADFEENEAFPSFGKNEWDQFRKTELEQVIRELYQIEPKIFSTLNTEQKKTFVYLLNLIIDSGERDSLLDILGQIVELDPSEREQLSQLLKTTSLTNIIKTIKLIEDRFSAIANLKELVFNKDLNANEPKHVQKFVENHYWIFGEQYHLVTAAEPKFEEALRRFIYLLRGDIEDVSMNHPDKKKEMDIFMVRQLREDGMHTMNNVVVELKHPNVKLGDKQLSQVKKYLSVILSEDEFNGNNMFWEFYLVGNSFDSTGYIEREIKNARQHGEKSLVYSVDNYKIYVKTWSEIFTDFELRHNFLLEKLEFERKRLMADQKSADDLIADIEFNSAKMPEQVRISAKPARIGKSQRK
ncbi:MAG: ATP-binding protein [Anaerolineaceae bacterium]|nr:MAG: ATP-binding protein [Anaerolineaceae bacterium]